MRHLSNKLTQSKRNIFLVSFLNLEAEKSECNVQPGEAALKGFMRVFVSPYDITNY